MILFQKLKIFNLSSIRLNYWETIFTTGCFLDFNYTKNHDRLSAVDLSWQKELDADPKAIQQIEFLGQLNN